MSHYFRTSPAKTTWSCDFLDIPQYVTLLSNKVGTPRTTQVEPLEPQKQQTKLVSSLQNYLFTFRFPFSGITFLKIETIHVAVLTPLNPVSCKLEPLYGYDFLSNYLFTFRVQFFGIWLIYIAVIHKKNLSSAEALEPPDCLKIPSVSLVFTSLAETAHCIDFLDSPRYNTLVSDELDIPCTTQNEPLKPQI